MQPLGSDNSNTQASIADAFAGTTVPMSKFPNRIQRFAYRTMRNMRSVTPRRVISSRLARMTAAGFICLAGGAFVLHSGSASIHSLAAALSTKAGFEANNLVVNGNKALGVDMLKGKLSAQLGGSLFEFDVDAARQNLISNPWVKSAEVRKVYPDTIVVDLVERVPVALWKADGVVNIISAEGHVIDEAKIEHMRLPQVVGKGANDTAAEFLSYINQYAYLTSKARAYVRVADRRWNIHLDNGPKIMLPEHNWKAALSELDDLNSAKNLLERDIIQVDLRLPDRLVLKMSSDQAKIRKTAIEKALEKKWHKI